MGLVACGGRAAKPGEAAVAELAARTPPQRAAAAPLRRLTAEQYRHSVRDLLGVKAFAAELPLDEGTAGFFGNTLAPVSELQLEQYGRAAEVIARGVAARLPRLALEAGRCTSAEATTPACVGRFIAAFGRRVYRRPLAADEHQQLMAVYRAAQASVGAAPEAGSARKAGDDVHAAGLRLVVQSLLSSPNFLYLVEPPPAATRGGAVAAVPGWALAARLSYFLWGSAPDETLLAAAESGRLGTPEGLRDETVRLMKDDRFGDTVASFHLQWLDLTELGGVEKRNRIYPLFTPQLRAAMQEETVRFVNHVVRADDGKLETLLGGRYSIVGQGLFEVYGLGKKTGDAAAWRKVDLSSAQRAGLLSHASFLTRHAHWDKPSLVLRGKVIRERLFCTDLPPPPPDVNNTPPPFDPKVSMRERFEDHRSEVSCAKCHRMIDPLGIPFESYDGIGALRTMDGPVAVDPSSDVELTAKTNGPVKNAIELVDRLARSEEVADCVVLQWLRYALGREVGVADAASLASLRALFRESGHRVPVLLAAIPMTDSFRYVEVTR